MCKYTTKIDRVHYVFYTQNRVFNNILKTLIKIPRFALFILKKKTKLNKNKEKVWG